MLSALLCGDPASAGMLERTEVEALIDAARRHGVLPLVADRVALAPDVAPGLRRRLAVEARASAAVDLAREVEMRAVLDVLQARGVDVLVLKGGQLAYTHYARPDLRPRDDTDLLVPAGARAAAHDALVGLGYRPRELVTGDHVLQQAMYERRRDGVLVHTVDLHWRVANPQVFADVLTFEELRADAVPLAALGRQARGAANPHALMLACVHRVAHHRDDESLIWLYDIHLLASSLSDGEWPAFAALAREKGTLAICLVGLDRAAAHFGTAVPPAIREALSAAVPGAAPEPTALFLRRGRAQLSTLISDLTVLSSWRQRARLIREHLLPTARYMREVYAPSSRAPLSWLYARRAIRGAWRWLRRDEAARRL